jgi:hypothetical protein
MTDDQTTLIISKIDALAEQSSVIVNRLDVHVETHVRIEKEHGDFLQDLREQRQLIREQEKKAQATDELARQTAKDLERITGNLSRFVWLVIAQVVVAVFGVIGGVVYLVTQ